MGSTACSVTVTCINNQTKLKAFFFFWCVFLYFCIFFVYFCIFTENQAQSCKYIIHESFFFFWVVFGEQKKWDLKIFENLGKRERKREQKEKEARAQRRCREV